MSRAAFVVTIKTESYDDGTHGPYLKLAIHHSSKVETVIIPVPDNSKGWETAEEAVDGITTLDPRSCRVFRWPSNRGRRRIAQR